MNVTSVGARPVIYGEVLYDCFPDGVQVLGGAPFNVAWHLQGFGHAPLFISRVGEDALGEGILTAMRDWGMDSGGVQRDAHHPTGRVLVRFEHGEPGYEIVPEQAYDFIEAAPARAQLQAQAGALLYHGSLIARHDHARASLDALRAADLPVYLDVNLRAPWWRREWLIDALKRTRWVKLNEHELAILAQREVKDEAQLLACAEALRRANEIEILIVTRGARGALLFADDGLRRAAPVAVGEVVDTVGAGDAFSAVSIAGLLRGWPLPLLAERAVDFAAAVCRQRGATRPDPKLYERYLRQWGE